MIASMYGCWLWVMRDAWDTPPGLQRAWPSTLQPELLLSCAATAMQVEGCLKNRYSWCWSWNKAGWSAGPCVIGLACIELICLLSSSSG